MKKMRCIKRVQWDNWGCIVTVALPGQVCSVKMMDPEHYPLVCVGTDNGCGFSMEEECTVCTRMPSLILYSPLYPGITDSAPLDCFEEV